MEDYLSQDLGILDPDDIVEVIIDHPANVQLLDPANFENYKNRKPFEYAAGGYAEESPFRMNAPHRGRWYLVVDLGGGPGIVRASVRVVSPSAA